MFDARQDRIHYIHIKNLLINDELGLSLLAADSSIWIFSRDHQLAELDWNGNVLQSFSHDSQLETERAFINRSRPAIYFERNVTGQKKSYLLNRKGKVEALGSNYWFPMMLPGKEIPAIRADIVFDASDFSSKEDHIFYKLPFGQGPNAISINRGYWYDKKGNFWVATNFGFWKISIRKNLFRSYLAGTERFPQAIRGIYAKGHMIITNIEDKGPVIINTAIGASHQLKLPGKNFGFFAVKSLKKDQIAIGTRSSLFFMDREGTIGPMHPVPHDVWAIHQISDSVLWLGTTGGLYTFNLTTDNVRRVKANNRFKTLEKAHITHITEARDGNWWICSNQGLFKMNDTLIVAHYAKSAKANLQLPHDVIYHLYEDEEGLWAATGGGGLLYIDLKTSSAIRQITSADGLSNEVIYAVYPDPDGRHLWLASDYGIMRYDKQTGTVETFLTKDGLPNNEFNRIAHFQNADGTLYFGTINGLIAFSPSEFEEVGRESDPPLAVVNYQQFDGKSSKMEDRSKTFQQSGEIVLQQKDRFFRINLALLNFSDVSKNRYAFLFAT